ncbi:glutamate carboxypeptidase [Planoprotostelium fungivorum]|uniref:Glutamate carboxypeptidase n=1 Tax=Planoprotostelium fungivorum TaxID=1890364 RepID=A0A2P6NKP5_9EUKA|nr:glutamate carboxypeptidase [Planoprotostelium fungivorum]
MRHITTIILFFFCSTAHTSNDVWQDAFLKIPRASKARKHLHYYTSLPHSAGTIGDYQTAVYTHKEFQKYGFNSSIEEEQVLLNFPIRRKLTLLEPIFYEAKLKEDTYREDPSTFDPNIMDTFSGNVTAEVVYLNYGSKGDFDLLRMKGIELRGKIGLARYGKLYRGAKVMLSQGAGMVGLLIYSDPVDDGFLAGKTYPNGPFGPTSHVQRGCVQPDVCPGDPRRKVLSIYNAQDELTVRQICAPDDPDWSYEKGIANIPVLPISYQDALPVLNNLHGNPLPDDTWMGAAGNEFIGPGPALVNLDVEIKFNVTPIWNVIASIPGQDPSESVLLGNHRDAWVLGAVDPNSGSAVMLEAARGIGHLYTNGWRPKRNIIFASWDAEEYGLLGSVAWAEKNDRENDRLVAYINTDSTIYGKNLACAATPSLERVFRKVNPFILPFFSRETKVLEKIRDPETGERLSNVFGKRNVSTIGGGSDYTSFLNFYGVPSLDFYFEGDYGVYHSVYDDFYWMSHFGDPTFEYHRAAAQLFGLLAMEMSEEELFFDFSRYAERLREYLDVAVQYVQPMNDTIDFEPLKSAVEVFRAAADLYVQHVSDSSFSVGQLHKQAMAVERAFIGDLGLPGRYYYRHVIQAPGIYEGYDSTPFPGLLETSMEGKWDHFSRQYDLLIDRILAAAEILSGGQG